MMMMMMMIFNCGQVNFVSDEVLNGSQPTTAEESIVFRVSLSSCIFICWFLTWNSKWFAVYSVPQAGIEMSRAYLDALTLLGSPSKCATAMSRSESMCIFTQTRQETGVSRTKRHEGLYNKLLYDPYWSILALRKLQSADRCATTQGKINHEIPEFFYVWKRPPRPDSHDAHTSQFCQIQPNMFPNPLVQYTLFPWVLGLERDRLNLWRIRHIHKKGLDDNSDQMHSRTLKGYLSNMDTICSSKKKNYDGLWNVGGLLELSQIHLPPLA